MGRKRRAAEPDPPVDEDEHKEIEEGSSKLGHNGGPPELTDEQQQALFFQHLKKVRSLKERIASASGELRAAYKIAKAELGKDARAMIRDALELETDDGQAKMEEAIARQARVARWMATPLGSQADMFGDVQPAIDRARAAGKVARLQGEPLKPPHDPSVPQFQAWADGWHDGDKLLIEAQKRDDAVLFDHAAKIGDQAATFTETTAAH